MSAKRGTRTERTVAIIGIVLLLLNALAWFAARGSEWTLWGPLSLWLGLRALGSYRAWRSGDRDTPATAWFGAWCLVTQLVLTFVLVIAAPRWDPEEAGTVAFVTSIVLGFAGPAWMRRAVATRAARSLGNSVFGDAPPIPAPPDRGGVR